MWANHRFRHLGSESYILAWITASGLESGHPGWDFGTWAVIRATWRES